MDIFIWVLSFVSILVFNFNIATAQWGKYCDDSGTYTQNSTYNRDLDNVLYSLTATNNGYGFYNSTFGQANAAAVCRGDIQPDTCRRCVEDTSRELRRYCPNQIDAAIWYDPCLLRYSNQSMGYGIDLSFYAYDPNNISDSHYEQWVQMIANLFGALRTEAAGGGQFRKYGSGNRSTSPALLTIYGIMQCSPDLSVTECDVCLDGALKDLKPYDRKLGVGVYKSGCIIRYEFYKFFDSTWYPAVLPSSGNTRRSNIGLIVGPILATVVVIVAVVIFIFGRRQKQKPKGCLLPELQVGLSKLSSEGNVYETENVDSDSEEMNFFNFSTLQVATNNFSPENKLGEGGFGPVYKGELQDGKQIAVKRLSKNSGQGLAEFKTEIRLIIKLQHKNLVRLLGICVKGTERLLVYEFMANNSLETFLFDPNKSKELDWSKRANIVSGIAKGLRYLHEDSRLKIIHRDMKAGNILLDHEMNSKISDFGTARIFGGNQSEANTIRIVGTYGYMAPEYAMEGLFSTKSDVYSFGVLLLEIISGQRNYNFCFDDERQHFLSTVWRLWKENKGEQLIDRCLAQNFPMKEALRWINIALLCVQEDPQDRPNMSAVVFMLDNQLSPNLPKPSEPPLSINRLAAFLEQTTTTSDISVHQSIKLASSVNIVSR